MPAVGGALLTASRRLSSLAVKRTGVIAVSGQSSVVGGQWSVVSGRGQWPVVSGPLSVAGGQ